jgi:hypothetical protein
VPSGEVPADDDPLSGVLALPGVEQSLAEARAAVDALLWDRGLTALRPRMREESALRGAWCNAWFDGAETRLEALASGSALDTSPMGRVLTGVVGLHAEVPHLVAVVGTAPAQALARMHAVVARGMVDETQLGRPRRGAPDDPLRLGPAPDPDQAAARLAGVVRLLASARAPGVLVAALAHAELAVVRPFEWGSGLVARALIRLVLAQRGVDPELLVAPEVGLRELGRPAYVRALKGYRSGTPEGVSGLCVHVAQAVALGAGAVGTWPAD